MKILLKSVIQMNSHQLNATFEKDLQQRLDLFLLEIFPNHSRSSIQRQITNGNVKVNQKIAKPSIKLKVGDVVSYPDFSIDPSLKLPIEPLDIKLDIIFENKDVLIINKPAGIAVHPSKGNEHNTLVNALINYDNNISSVVLDPKSELSLSRPGIIHRLDKDTSGIMMVAKNINSFKYLSNQIKSRKIQKIYHAICFGWPKNQNDVLINYLGRSNNNRLLYTEVGINKGRESVSKYKVLDYFKNTHGDKFSYVEFDIKTGRTHQIRTQSLLMGNPVIGDKSYYNKQSLKFSKCIHAQRQMLHAYSLKVILPDHNAPSEFFAPLPDDFKSMLSISIIK